MKALKNKLNKIACLFSIFFEILCVALASKISKTDELHELLCNHFRLNGTAAKPSEIIWI